MNDRNNRDFKYENKQTPQAYGTQQFNQQHNYKKPYPNQSNFPFNNSVQQQYQSQSSYGQSSTTPNVGLSTNYTSSNENKSKIKLISRGKGINDKEYDVIVSSCIQIQDSKAPLPLSIKCINKIKEQIGGEWFVLVCSESETNYDFYLSYIKSQKNLSFTYSGNEYDVYLIS